LDTVSTIALRYILNLSWIPLAIVVLMTAAFYLLFENLVYHPLEQLLSAMEKARAGNLSAEVFQTDKENEFGLLAKGYNAMMRQIREMTVEREKQNEILQEKVSEATAELQTQNEQLETANLELFRASRKMSEMERLAATGQTAAEFAHEIGTPLNLISGHVQILQTQLLEDSTQSNRLQIVTNQIERIENIVREMLDRARFGATEHKPLNLNEVLKTIFDVAEPTLAESRIELKINLAENLPYISGNAERLQQVFLNLVKNALDAMPDGGRLEVSTANAENKVRVKFADNGIGMSEETRGRIFQVLFTTKERGRGTGLGLVVVRQILQEHRAEIQVESKSGQGAKFDLYFPVI
ncbi:MAG: ATP-binding protein, partial [Acidobacteriota bacterium]|nr:ATP-binding protein [Acidobacteriota bacterium]